MNQSSLSSSGPRGPVDHEIRDQIVAAANEHFSQNGYGKTTVSDLARAIGFSKAYIYKFFDSKQAIGEAICTGVDLFFNDRKLYDIAAFSAAERWPCAQVYEEQIKRFIFDIVREGRELGEFERKTPLDETVEAIHLALRPFVNPLLLQHNLGFIEVAPTLTSNLILRSLMP